MQTFIDSILPNQLSGAIFGRPSLRLTRKFPYIRKIEYIFQFYYSDVPKFHLKVIILLQTKFYLLFGQALQGF